jgi:hypothetical protein
MNLNTIYILALVGKAYKGFVYSFGVEMLLVCEASLLRFLRMHAMAPVNNKTYVTNDKNPLCLLETQKNLIIVWVHPQVHDNG